jgi:hypothetical protein
MSSAAAARHQAQRKFLRLLAGYGMWMISGSPPTRQQLLQVDTGHRRREVDAGALHALIDGEAGIHFSSLYLLPGKKTFCKTALVQAIPTQFWRKKVS